MRGDYKTIKKLVCGKIREFVLMPTYDGDIKELWQEIAEDKDSYYVYSYGKIIDGEFNHRYIGIGTFRRYKQAKRDNSPLMGNMRINKYYKIIICKIDNREESSAIEQQIITFLGRKDVGTGDLYNLSDGGEAGFLGGTHSKETRAKMSESLSGENHPMFGKKHTEEAKKKLSEANKGKNNPMFKDKSHITDEVLFNHLQSCKSWSEEIPSDWGVNSHMTIRKIFKNRYSVGLATKVQDILAERLGFKVLNHINFIEYCEEYSNKFLQKANEVFGITGEQLQRWAARTYKKARSQTIDGWQIRAKQMESHRRNKEKKINSKTL